LWVEHLAARVEILLNPELEGCPLALLRAWDEQVLDAVCLPQGCSIEPGDSRRGLEQLCPEALIVPAREGLYQSYHDRLRDLMLEFSDAVESCAWGQLYIETTRLDRHFPSEKTLALDMVAQAQQISGLQPAVGIAANKFTALQAARRAAAESSRAWVVPPGQERSFLARLPLAILPEPPLEMLRRLDLFAVSNLGGLARLPRPAFILQFGIESGLFHDLARGIDPRPLEPEAPPPLTRRQVDLPDPLADRVRVLVVLDRLVEDAGRELLQSGYQAAGLCLTLQTATGQHPFGAAVTPPSADIPRLQRLAARLLGKLRARDEVTGLELVLYPLRPWQLGAQQMSLFDPPVSARQTRIDRAIHELRQRFGATVIQLAGLLGPPCPLPIQVRTGPDHMPQHLEWDRGAHSVTSVYESWRVDRNWWNGYHKVQEYFQVETSTGLVFTLFRDEKDAWFLDRRYSHEE
jgi:DNA polymerase-4